ncbi:MAG: redoxin family protein [Ferruginibacter sp.]|nr:redoxin family protein [Cytophagales bacterium]
MIFGFLRRGLARLRWGRQQARRHAYVLLCSVGLGVAGAGKAPQSSLPAVRSDASLAVYVFLATECPLSQSYTLPLNQLSQRYAASKVTFTGVFPAEDDQNKNIRDFVNRYRVAFAVRRDPQQRLTRQFGATVTPEAFLVDGQERVLYAGKIDDWAISLGRKRPVVTEKYLEEAIRAALAGRPVAVARTEAVGCLIEALHQH